eukprot:scaffold81843_cov17-Prasinocladus_malaysianus.AAC.1
MAYGLRIVVLISLAAAENLGSRGLPSHRTSAPWQTWHHECIGPPQPSSQGELAQIFDTALSYVLAAS